MVGGGIVGLSCAWELARRGARVAVVDPGEPAARATWAAGGMLAPLGEAPEPGAFLELGMRSLALYPDFARGLEDASGRPVGLHLNGKLLTAATPEEEEALARRRDWLLADVQPVRWMSGEAARSLEPSVAPGTRAGLLLEGNGRVDNRALQEALETAVDAEGVRRMRGRALGLCRDAGRVTGVILEEAGELAAEWVVLAAGAWSGTLTGLPRPLPVRPVKGQMLAFAAPARPLSRVVTSSRAYLIPRETPRGPLVVVGATSEEAGFDLSVDLPGQARLEAGAVALVPALARASVVERWAGLRPGIPDGLPVLGPEPAAGGLVYATGHFRNGILLAPVTALAVSGWITGRPPAGMAAFSPGRFPR